MSSRGGIVTTVCTLVVACAPGEDERHTTERDSVASTGAVHVADSLRTCFVANRSVLARGRDAAAPAPADLRGWIRLDQFDVNDSAGATLVDTDGFSLDAGWKRITRDSIVVSGFNDFVRIEMRLRHERDEAIGTLRASSDAALERDPAGNLREFRRSLNVRLREAPCDSMPSPAGRAAVDILPHGTPRPGLRFDPVTIRRGEAVGVLTVDSVDARVAAVDNTVVGTARFSGAIELTGWTLKNPDPDLGRVLTCFEADSASASRLPRWMGDERRPWFCFSNRADAARALGPPSEGVPATIVVDEFTIHRGMSDEVNIARFVRLVRRG